MDGEITVLLGANPLLGVAAISNTHFGFESVDSLSRFLTRSGVRVFLLY